MATIEDIFFEGNLVEGAPFSDADRVVVEVLDDDDAAYRFAFTLMPSPNSDDPQRVRVIMHRESNRPPRVQLQGGDDAVPAT